MPVDGGFHQRRIRYSARSQIGFRIICSATHRNGYQLRGALAVARHLASKLLGHGIERLTELDVQHAFFPRQGSRRSGCLTGSKQNASIVGGSVTVYSYLVEALVYCRSERLMQQRCGNGGVGGEHRNHSGHIRHDHA